MRDLMNKFQQLQSQLNQLASLDVHRDILGTEVHHYQLNPCLSEVELKAFEQKYKITLPEDYRNFLLLIGNGGAGPGYGLFGIGYENEMTKILQQEGDDFLCQAFSGWDDDDEFADSPAASDNSLIQGSIPIAHYACGIFAQLVITGEERGKIWIDDRAGDGDIYPCSETFCCMFHGDEDDDEEEEEEEEALSFYDWYDDWRSRSRDLLAQ